MGAKATLLARLAVTLPVLLAGCSITPELLQSQADAASQNYIENYEAVYRRVASMARRCLIPKDLVISSFEVEAELHKELGFADVRLVVISVGIPTNYFLSARIEKLSTGSRVSVKTNNALVSERLSKMVFRWAGGDDKC